MQQSPTVTQVRCCLICGGDCESIGRIYHPVPTMVAGVEIDLGGFQFRILGCRSCGFQFKDPGIPSERLLECYARASGNHWDSGAVDPYHRYFDVMRDMLHKQVGGGRVLDIGCFTGALLSYLGDSWHKFGVEPSVEAAAVARERGVTILGATLDDLSGQEARFDAVVATDLVEHIEDPIPFFRRVHSVLKVGGTFLIVTGDTSAPAWRILRSRYWYCNLPEHVSFFSAATLREVAKIVGFEPLEYLRLSHARFGFCTRFVEWLKTGGYVAALKLKGFGSSAMYKTVSQRRGPTTLSARDHLFFTMRRR